MGAVCATTGIIIGVLSLTGLGLKFSGLLVTLSGGSMAVLLEFALSLLSLSALSAAIEGCYRVPFAPWERAVLAVCSLCMLQPLLAIEVACNLVILLMMARNFLRARGPSLQG